ncbi:DoxX family protein [Mycobacterium sp. Marseille-P9652]|uniref:DoxX family protein n=1 Tax=Mycobacterium sp. Marseille-P9652 TaxID=2654950 RepID=UPI001E2B58B3|nr:DoxX family protein [Mycobacterium sp. Marseille-P9652]
MMNVLLWTLQISLAAIFTASGLAKISMPRDRLIATGQTGIAPFPMPVVRLTAFSELLGAIGIVVPRLVGVAEFLIPAAAGGLAIVMVGAMASHAYLREPRNVAVNVAIFIAAVTLAVGRGLGL